MERDRDREKKKREYISDVYNTFFPLWSHQGPRTMKVLAMRTRDDAIDATDTHFTPGLSNVYGRR